MRECWTSAQNAVYNSLTPKQQNYVDLRCQGFGKADSYKRAGFLSKDPCHDARVLEKRHNLQDLIDSGTGQYKLQALRDPNSDFNMRLNQKALTEKIENEMAKIEGADGETARRIIFFRDIVDGRIKTVKKTTTLDSEGRITSVKIEENSDVAVRMQARKELDRILGLNSFVAIDKLQVKDITINIVDASKKEEVADSRNQIVLDEKNIEVINGEEVIVTESSTEKQRGRPKKVVEVNGEETNG